MTDDEIKDLMYEYADSFSSCVQFKEESLLDFARALLEQAGYNNQSVEQQQKPEPPAYTNDLWRFMENVDRFIDGNTP